MLTFFEEKIEELMREGKELEQMKDDRNYAQKFRALLVNEPYD